MAKSGSPRRLRPSSPCSRLPSRRLAATERCQLLTERSPLLNIGPVRARHFSAVGGFNFVGVDFNSTCYACSATANTSLMLPTRVFAALAFCQRQGSAAWPNGEHGGFRAHGDAIDAPSGWPSRCPAERERPRGLHVRRSRVTEWMGRKLYPQERTTEPPPHENRSSPLLAMTTTSPDTMPAGSPRLSDKSGKRRFETKWATASGQLSATFGHRK